MVGGGPSTSLALPLGLQGIGKKKPPKITFEDEMDDDMDDDFENKEDGWESDFDLQHRTAATLLSEKEQKEFNTLLADVVLPAGIERLPSNLGGARHGKLKQHSGNLSIYTSFR